MYVKTLQQKTQYSIMLQLIDEVKNTWVEINLLSFFLWILKCYYFYGDLFQNEKFPSIGDKYQSNILYTAWHVALHNGEIRVSFFLFMCPPMKMTIYIPFLPAWSIGMWMSVVCIIFASHLSFGQRALMSNCGAQWICGLFLGDLGFVSISLCCVFL